MANFTNYADVLAALQAESNVYNPTTTQPGWEAAHAQAQEARQWWANYSSSNAGSSGGTSAAPSYVAPPPAPPLPPAATTYAVKQPDVALVQYNAETLPQTLLSDLLYEDVGGTELITISRHDTINGQDVTYSLIKNLSVLNQTFNPNNILAGQTTYSSYMNQYALDIASKINNIPAYLDNDGNLIIEFSSTNPDEYVEVEMSTDGTIYKIGA